MLHGLFSKICLRKPVQSVGGAAFIIAVAGIASRLLGFFRDRILASQFGAGDVLDSYYAAFRIPDLLYGLLIAGALSAAFVPVFTDLYINKREEDAWKMSNGIMQLLILVLGSLSIFIFLFSPYLTDILVPGFSPEKQEMTLQLTRIMLLSPILLGISAVFGGILVSLKRFLLYSIAPVFYNIGIIIGAVCFVPTFGVSGLAWGVVFGAFMHVAVQYIDLRVCGFRYSFSLKGLWADVHVRKIVKLMIPRSIGMAVSQVNFLIITVFASMLASGSLAVFTLANNIQSVPLGLFGIAFSLAVFPSLSALASKKSNEEFFTLFARTFRRILFFVFPLSVFIIILRAQIVRVILGSGQFDWNDTIETFNVLGILSISLFAQSLIPLLARAFFALHDTKTPLYIALVSEVFHVGLMYMLVSPFHIIGLAAAFSIATILNMVFLYIALRRRFPVWNDKDIFSPSLKIVFSSLIAGAAAQITKTAFGFQGNEIDTFLAILIQLIVTSSVGVSVFIALGWWMRIEEFEHVKRFFMQRIFGQPQNLIEAEEQIDKSGSHA